jgi:hypothetical protein
MIVRGRFCSRILTAGSVVGNVWLFTYEVSNIATDLMLMALPFTLICSVTVPITQ